VKKVIGVILCCLVILNILAACNKTNKDNPANSTTKETQTEANKETIPEGYEKVAYEALKNGGFENGMGAWSQEQTVPQKCTDEKKEGDASILIDNPKGGDCHMWQSMNFALKPGNPAIGDRVMGSFQIKIDQNVKPQDGKFLLFKIETYSQAKGKKILASVKLMGDEKKEEWLYFETPAGDIIEDGSETLTVAFENELEGTVYLDEVKVYKVVPEGQSAVKEDDVEAETGTCYNMNSSFEDALEPWGTYIDKAEPVSMADGGKDGMKALLMDNKTEGFTAVWNTLDITIDRDTPYIGDVVKATAWVKFGDDVSAVEGKKCYFKLEHYSEEKGKTLIGGVDILGTEAKGDWFEVEIPAAGPIPEGEETVTVAFENGLPGKIYVDKVEIIRISGATPPFNGGFETGLQQWGVYADKAEPVAYVDGGKDSLKAMLMNNKTEGFTAVWNTVAITTETETPSIGDSLKASAWIKLGDDVSIAEGKKCFFKLEHYSEEKGKTLIGGVDIIGDEEKGKWFKIEIPAGSPIPEGEETVTVAFENGLSGKIYVDEVLIEK